MSEKKPIYDSRVRRIMELLKFKTRDEAAEELGYSTYKSMDQYMRRKKFRFHAEENQYIPRENKTHKIDRDPKSYAPTKVVNIITAFEEANPDPRLIAKQEGFTDHKEMAEYMVNKGYEWNAYKNNHVKTIGKVEEEKTVDEAIKENSIHKAHQQI